MAYLGGPTTLTKCRPKCVVSNGLLSKTQRTYNFRYCARLREDEKVQDQEDDIEQQRQGIEAVHGASFS